MFVRLFNRNISLMVIYRGKCLTLFKTAVNTIKEKVTKPKEDFDNWLFFAINLLLID